MIKFMRSAVVVVACLFAGVGAWGAMVTVGPVPVYASELFGPGHGSPEYPADINAEMEGNQDGTPVVTLTIPKNLDARPASTSPVHDACPAVDHSGAAEVTFTLVSGTFDANVSGLMWDPVVEAPAVGDGLRTAPASVASITSGGRKGDNSITIKIEEATESAAGTDAHTERSSDSVAPDTASRACRAPASATNQTISFEMPRLAGLDALAGATADSGKSISLTASSRLVSGAFTSGSLTGTEPVPVISALDSLTVAISDDNTKTVAIDDDADKDLVAFKSVKEKNKDGYVELATVTIRTRQEASAATAAIRREIVGQVQATAGTDATTDAYVYKPMVAAVSARYHELFDLDGDVIDEGLRGAFSVSAAGTRGLFNDDDMLFVDYDKNGKPGAGEAIAIDGNMATGGSLSIDAERSESFDMSGTGMFKVYYMPGGKMDINHGTMINLTATVDYSDPSAIDETLAKSSTTLNFDGVGNPARVYAIPHSTNGTGDKGNVRVRCEEPASDAAACRVFLECWDDMGNRGFGEAPMIAADSLARWDGAAIEGVTGMEPTSRHSCRVLSRGMVTVQQLTRDGNSGTLVNNTYVGGGM